MVENGHIPSPLPLRMRRLQHQALPILVVLVCAVLAAVLWSRQVRSAVGTGEVNAVQILLESKVPGMLRELPRPVEMFDGVKAGDVVARIDMSLEEAELRRIAQELAVLEGNATTQPASADATAKALAANATTAWYHTRIDELQARIQAQEVKTPIAGTVVRIIKRPGESAVAGKPIMTIAADSGEFIAGYFHQNQGARPAPGAFVQIRGRGKPIRSFRSSVLSVSPQVELLPVRHRRNPLVEEWGFVAQIAIPKSAQIKPGEMLDLALEAPAN